MFLTIILNTDVVDSRGPQILWHSSHQEIMSWSPRGEPGWALSLLWQQDMAEIMLCLKRLAASTSCLWERWLNGGTLYKVWPSWGRDRVKRPRDHLEMGKDLTEPSLPATPARVQGMWGRHVGPPEQTSCQLSTSWKPQSMPRGAEEPASWILPKFPKLWEVIKWL